MITTMSTTSVSRERTHVAWVEYARPGALVGSRTATGRCAVSPVQAPSTGGVRPQAGNAFLVQTALNAFPMQTTDLGATDKGEVRVRSLGPPI